MQTRRDKEERRKQQKRGRPPRPGEILSPPHTMERVWDFSREVLIIVPQEAGPLASRCAPESPGPHKAEVPRVP